MAMIGVERGGPRAVGITKTETKRFSRVCARRLTRHRRRFFFVSLGFGSRPPSTICRSHTPMTSVDTMLPQKTKQPKKTIAFFSFHPGGSSSRPKSWALTPRLTSLRTRSTVSSATDGVPTSVLGAKEMPKTEPASTSVTPPTTSVATLATPSARAAWGRAARRAVASMPSSARVAAVERQCRVAAVRAASVATPAPAAAEVSGVAVKTWGVSGGGGICGEGWCLVCALCRTRRVPPRDEKRKFGRVFLF